MYKNLIQVYQGHSGIFARPAQAIGRYDSCWWFTARAVAVYNKATDYPAINHYLGKMRMCDTWVALSDSTATQQVIFAKNSDRPIFDAQPLMFYPRQDWPAGSRVQLEYIDIPQARQTYATLGSSPYWCWGYEEGINEHRVVIGNEAIFTRTFRQLAAAHRQGQVVAPGLLGMDVIRLALERGQTAQQAVEVMGQLIEQYGQFGSGVPTQDHETGGYDNSFLIADPREAWVLEAVGRRWVAQRVRQGTAAISNQPTIRQDWDAGSDDVVAYAQHMGWWPADMPFDFARAYVDEKTARQVSHLRLMRSRQLLAERQGQISPAWMKRIARDHYEDTFLCGPGFDAADPDFLSICMHVSPADFTWGNTASSCVAVLPDSDDELPVFWWTPGPPCNGCYVPFFVHGSQIPDMVSRAGTAGKQVMAPPAAAADQFAPDSYWWLFRQLLDQVKGDAIRSRPGHYAAHNPLVRARFDALEAEFAAQVPEVMAQAVTAGEVNAQVLDDFTATCVQRVLTEVQQLLETIGQPVSTHS
jgi:secernin